MAGFCNPQEENCLHIAQPTAIREVKCGIKHYAVEMRVTVKEHKRNKPYLGYSLMAWLAWHKAALSLKMGVQPFLSMAKRIPSLYPAVTPRSRLWR